MAVKSKVLVVGGTGYIGRRIVKASLAQGHETFILQRPDIGLDIDKLQMLLSFKKQGARLVEGSFNDHQSLVDAVKQVDVVICPIAGTAFRGHEILLQLKLVEAIKEAGNIKRFLPSEFGMDVARMGHALEQGKETIADKMVVRKAIEDADIPFTYISANAFAGYFIGNLGDLLHSLTPPKENKVYMFGDGNVKAVFTDEDDIGTYTIKAIDDPRTLNKTVYIRPPQNILCQTQVVDMYERLTGKKMERIYISEKDFLVSMEGMDYVHQAGVGHFYHFFYEGCLANFEVGEDEEASKLYPEVQTTSMEDYLKQYISKYDLFIF